MAKKRSRRKTCLDSHMGGFQDCDAHWFLSELLCRSSVEDVFRFKCVSKQWFSFISDPSFGDFYISRSPVSRRRCQFTFLPFKYDCDVDDESRLKYPERHFLTLPTPPPDRTGISFSTIAADKGFLLIICHETEDDILSPFNPFGRFYICSATTHQWISLPSPHNVIWDIHQNVGFITQVEAGVLTSYKVGVLLSDPKRSWDYGAEVFSSETGEWEFEKFNIQSKDEVDYEFSSSERPVHLNNTIYWVDNYDNGEILAYNPYTGPKALIIELPTNRNKKWVPGLRNYKFGVCQGRLKYIDCEKVHQDANDGDFVSLKVWELGEDSCWCVQNTVRTKEIIGKPFSFHPSDPHKLFFYLEEKEERFRYNLGENFGLVSYDLLTDKVEPLSPSSLLLIDGDSYMVEIPPWPVSISPSLIEDSYIDSDIDW